MTKGFSLLEITVVLLIITIIAGAIAYADTLILKSEARKFITDIQEYEYATRAFKDEFDFHGGDFPRAKSIWSECEDYTDNPCNGDGNGRITGDASDTEVYRFYQHLALAGYLPGSYTGQQAAGFSPYIPGENIPSTSYRESIGPLILDLNPDGIYFTYGLMFVFITPNPASPNGFSTSMSPRFAYEIDQKIDDGDPWKGNVYVISDPFDATASCMTGDVNSSTRVGYTDLASNDEDCSIVYFLERYTLARDP